MMSHLVINFCKREQMSICTADNQKQQVGCSYYEKSQFAERCMYYIFEEYCDSLTAQINAQQVLRSWKNKYWSKKIEYLLLSLRSVCFKLDPPVPARSACGSQSDGPWIFDFQLKIFNIIMDSQTFWPGRYRWRTCRLLWRPVPNNGIYCKDC